MFTRGRATPAPLVCGLLADKGFPSLLTSDETY